jgi:hypothetical protein
MKSSARYLTLEQCASAEAEVPTICARGGWTYRTCAVGPDHVHILCDLPRDVHGEKVRRLVKRWLGQKLSQRWPLPPDPTWWAEEGSNKAIRDQRYLDIFEQRATQSASRDIPVPE